MILRKCNSLSKSHEQTDSKVRAQGRAQMPKQAQDNEPSFYILILLVLLKWKHLTKTKIKYFNVTCLPLFYINKFNQYPHLNSRPKICYSCHNVFFCILHVIILHD